MSPVFMPFQHVFVAYDLYAADRTGEQAVVIAKADSWLVAKPFPAAYLWAAFLDWPCQVVVVYPAFEDFSTDDAPLFIGG